MRCIGMPSKYTMNVSLTQHLCDFVATQVASGRFGTSSEVVRAALRLLERDLNPASPLDGDENIKTDPAISAVATLKKAGPVAQRRASV